LGLQLYDSLVIRTRLNSQFTAKGVAAAAPLLERKPRETASGFLDLVEDCNHHVCLGDAPQIRGSKQGRKRDAALLKLLLGGPVSLLPDPESGTNSRVQVET